MRTNGDSPRGVLQTVFELELGAEADAVPHRGGLLLCSSGLLLKDGCNAELASIIQQTNTSPPVPSKERAGVCLGEQQLLVA